MIITGIDVETTGLEQEKGDKIIEICCISYDSKSRKPVYTYEQRIHPQRSIQAKAQEVHGISIDDLAGCPVWDDVAPRIAKILKVSDILVAHNMEFDGPFVALELMRVGVDVPSVEGFCTMLEGRWATPLGKKPNLGELCMALNVPYDPSKAHGATYDVEVMMQCLFKGIDKGFYTLPEPKE